MVGWQLQAQILSWGLFVLTITHKTMAASYACALDLGTA